MILSCSTPKESRLRPWDAPSALGVDFGWRRRSSGAYSYMEASESIRVRADEINDRDILMPASKHVVVSDVLDQR